MTETNANNVTPLRTPTDLVSEIVDLSDQIAHLTERLAARKRELGDAVGIGSHKIAGVDVSVREPNRRFNAARAAELLAPEVLELCRNEGYDPKKLRGFLAPVLLEQCMDAGTGAPVVSVR